MGSVGWAPLGTGPDGPSTLADRAHLALWTGEGPGSVRRAGAYLRAGAGLRGPGKAESPRQAVLLDQEGRR